MNKIPNRQILCDTLIELDITVIAAGETVKVAMDSAAIMRRNGVSCRVINMHTLKPLDEEAVIRAARETGHIITVEEHSIYGGLGAAVSQVVVEKCPVPMKMIAVPDEPAIPGKSEEVFEYYGLSSTNIAKVALEMLK